MVAAGGSRGGYIEVEQHARKKLLHSLSSRQTADPGDDRAPRVMTPMRLVTPHRSDRQSMDSRQIGVVSASLPSLLPATNLFGMSSSFA
jgi:hypothetical protein